MYSDLERNTHLENWFGSSLFISAVWINSEGLQTASLGVIPASFQLCGQVFSYRISVFYQRTYTFSFILGRVALGVLKDMG